MYKVIGEEEESKYAELLGTGKLLGDHPHQDKKSLALVLGLKPSFQMGDAGGEWLKKGVDDPDEMDPEDNEDEDKDKDE